MRRKDGNCFIVQVEFFVSLLVYLKFSGERLKWEQQRWSAKRLVSDDVAATLKNILEMRYVKFGEKTSK